ncbi:MAG: MFS transporter, partial [Chloroflexota bacterium]
MNIFGYNTNGPNAKSIYLSMRSTSSFAFSLIITYELVYHTIEIGLSPMQLVTVGVILECMTLFFEIPTGTIADSYSRRLSIIGGYFLIGVGFLIEGLFATFFAVILAQVLWGIGFTFYSGAGDAWIADEVGTEKASQLYLRGTQLSQVMSLIGVAVGAFTVEFGLKWPIILGSTIYLVMVPILMWYMSETGFTPSAVFSTQDLYKNTLTQFNKSIQ